MRRRLLLAAASVLALVLVAALVVGVRAWRHSRESALAQATAYAPKDAERLSWTDWSAIRRHVRAHVGPRSSADDVQAFLDDAFDDDLTSTSALVQSAPVLQTSFGFSPATADWELFSQSTLGAVVIVHLPDAAAVQAVAGRLRSAGFTEPRDDGGVWSGGPALLPEIGSDLTPELQYVALDPDDGLVLTSDRAGYLRGVLDRLGQDGPSNATRAVVDASGDPLSATVFDGEQACTKLAMSQADPDDQAAAARLVAEAGRVNPLTAYAMSVQPTGHLRVVMGFDDGDQARTNADTRAKLAAGPAPGQGGDFSDRFTVVSATARGDLATLDLKPEPGSYAFSDLANGPVLFATC